jgi:multiple sugar transport system substrate-binding protein
MSALTRVLSVLVIVALAACNPAADDERDRGAGETPGGSDAGADWGGAVSGSISTLGFGLPDEHATARVDSFEEAFPEVAVEITEGALDEQQFLSSVAAGDPPDVVSIDRSVIGTYAARGAIQPIDECLSTHDVSTDVFREAAIAQATLDGELYGIPDFYDIRIVLIDNVSLAEADLTPDDVDIADWQSLTAVAEAVSMTDGGDLSRIGFDPKLPEFFPLWVRANGGSVLSDDGRTAEFASEEAVEALEFAAGLYEPAGGKAAATTFSDTWDFFGGDNMFVQHQLGAFPMEQWYVSFLAGTTPDVDITVRPFTDRDGNPLTIASGNAWAIPTGARNPAAACAFITHMTSTETWLTAAQARKDAVEAEGGTYFGAYVANAEAFERVQDELVQVEDPMFADALQVVIDAQDAAFAIPASPAGQEVNDAWTAAVNSVLLEGADPREALEAAQEQAQAAIDGAGD